MRRAATAVVLRGRHREYYSDRPVSLCCTNPITSSLSYLMRFGRDELDFACDMHSGRDERLCQIPRTLNDMRGAAMEVAGFLNK